MRHCAAIAWFLGMACVLEAGDSNLLSPVCQDPYSIFQPSRVQLSRKLTAAGGKSVFGLSVDITPHQELNPFGILTAAKVQSTGVRVTTDEREFSATGTASLSDPSTFESSTDNATPKLLSSEAVQLDGSPRVDLDDANKEKEEQKYATSRDSFAWIAGTNNHFGMLELDLQPLSRVRYEAPQWNNENRTDVSVDLTFGARWLSGPSNPDLPPYLFNILINVIGKKQITDRLSIDAMISPGWYTDFSNKGIDAFRLPWHVVSFYQWSDDWQHVLGVTDLARDDIHYLPVVGLIYAPPEGDLRLDLVFPKPKIARRLWTYKEYERWLYISGELGGGSWAISRADRAYDVVTYRDYRLAFGMETQNKKGHATRLELGWIFDRSIQYRSNNGNDTPPDSLMIRYSTDY